MFAMDIGMVLYRFQVSHHFGSTQRIHSSAMGSGRFPSPTKATLSWLSFCIVTS
jgi:hypothetical protein